MAEEEYGQHSVADLAEGLEMELAGFEGRRDLNGARVRLVSQMPASIGIMGLRWRVVVIDVTPPELISV